MWSKFLVYCFLFILLNSICIYANEFDIAKSKFESIDKELNDVYKNVLQRYSNDTLFLKRFKDAQRAWLKYRDSHMASRFPVEEGKTPSTVWGSSYQICGWYELSKLTSERVKLIKKWCDSAEEGDICSGSYK